MNEKVIEVKNLNYQRPNGTVCADSLSFTLFRDDRVAITGANGSGKSTILQLIMGLHEGMSGEVKLFGQPCDNEAEFSQYRTRIGYVFQDPDDQLFCPTVLEDVCFGPINMGLTSREAESVAHETLRELGIEHLADQVSYLLSGGQKRLVSLATVLAMKPEALLLDEPTNGLDEDNYQRFIDIIKLTKLPFILVTHDVRLQEALADKIYKLDGGMLTSV